MDSLGLGRKSNSQNVKLIMEKINIEDLLKSGAHYGHPVSKWNPQFKPFIVAKKNGICIIDLKSTLSYLEKAVKELVDISKKGGNILFVGTKTQAKDIVQTCADQCGMFYIVERWLGGTLTNFSTIKKSINRLVMLDKESSSIYKDKTKKERSMLTREKLKLSDLHRGIKDMKHLPSALFVVDAKQEMIAIAEAKCLGIPTFGLVDTNTDPFSLDYPIPANDDSIKTIKLIMSYISDSILDSIGGSKHKEVTEETSKNEEPIIEDAVTTKNDNAKKEDNIDK